MEQSFCTEEFFQGCCAKTTTIGRLDHQHVAYGLNPLLFFPTFLPLNNNRADGEHDGLRSGRPFDTSDIPLF
jgi:hypothetical protein